jgi:hypothetical protein
VIPAVSKEKMIQTLSSPIFIVNSPSFQMAHLKSSGDICPHVCLQMQSTAEMAWQLVKCLLPSTIITSGNSNRGSEPIDKTLNDPSSPSLLISSPKATFLLTFSFVYLVTAMWHAHIFPVQMRTSLFRFPSKGNLGHDASLFVVPFPSLLPSLICGLDAQLSASTRSQLIAICVKMKTLLLVLLFGACQGVLGQNITDVPICAVRKIELVANGKMVLTLSSKLV